MNKPNPDADLLRRAAALARETAQAATEGPWVPERKGVLDGGDIEFVEATRRDAPHIALWHPGVAHHVAAMLACAASVPEHDRDSITQDRCGNCGTAHLTNIAQALLGEDSE